MLKVNFLVDPILAKFKKMTTLAGDMRPVLLLIRGQPLVNNPNTLIGGIGQQFIGQGTFFGSQWRDLSDKPFWAWWKKPKVYYAGGYADYKRVNFPGKTMLRANDKMFKAATIPGAEGNVETLTMTSIVWGIKDTEIPYAKYHMTGTKKMPKRPFLGITKAQQNNWKKLIAQYLLDLEQKAVTT